MRALVLEAFGKMVVQERPDPIADDDEALIAIFATGICGSDLHGYTGDNGRRVPGQIMGHETVGRIAALGAATDGTGLAVGQLVTFNPVVPCGACEASQSGDWQHCADRTLIGVHAKPDAAFADYVTVPASNVVPLSDGIPAEYGALIEPLAVSFHAARRAQVKSGDNVLIIGGGPIGQSSILAAKRRGAAKVIVSEVDTARRALCEQLGAIAVDPMLSSVNVQVRALFGGLADVAIDAVGITHTLNEALASTHFGGIVCLVGMGLPQVELDAYSVSTAERSIVGSFTYSDGDFREAAQWVSDSPPELPYLISRMVSLADAPEAFARLAAHDGTPGKVLVHFGN